MLDILEVLVGDKVQPPGALRLPKLADALLKPPASLHTGCNDEGQSSEAAAVLDN